MRSLFTLTTALALSACVLPTKLGDLTEGGTADPELSTGASSGASASVGGTDATDGPATGDTKTSTGEMQETGTTFEEDTQQAFGCEVLTEAECAAEPACMPRNAQAFAFDACPEGQVYLGCVPQAACDLALTPICRDGSEEVYLLSDGCVPPGFTECDASGLELCGAEEEDCGALDEGACLGEGDFCEPIFGHKHVLDGVEMCVDVDMSIFLACVLMDGVCPPFIPTVCPVGEPDERFDIPSGCIPPGFETCDGAGTPECK